MSAIVDQWDEADIEDAEYEAAQIDQDAPSGAAAQLRIDFGAHLEANYQRLVAQLYAITLDPGEAHEAVQDAYSRAWRNWAKIGREPDPAAWVRSVAVRSTMRSWRRMLGAIGLGRRRGVADGVDPRTHVLLQALGRLKPAERRAVVLYHMAGVSVEEIAAVEQVAAEIVESRLGAARHVVVEGLADELPAVLAGAQDAQRDEGEYR
ncbi:RNA polymerase sigma factor [Pseudonocardia sp. CA-107938]|uniref:RNA polymerase sigma factor n=1 Tax=Pseudonocardia sp. CA-107938 TaxID=3240021 RepID=UPI003D911851